MARQRQRNLLNAILERLPDEPDALHLLGALRDMQGRSLEALPLIERSIALMPEETGRWNDVGNVLAKINRKARCSGAYRRSIELAGRDHRRCQWLQQSWSHVVDG